MPKSRFNAVREKARASRHNPIHRAATENSANEAATTASITFRAAASNGQSDGDVLPVLKALPLPTAAASTSSTAHEDALWALTSLTGFLAVKAQRNELLAPKHDLVARVLLQLHGDRPIEVRDAASGCLRNLCIEAGGRARKALEAREYVMLCIEEVQRVAQALHLIEGGDGDESTFTSQALNKQKVAFLNKPENEMNRKERRHAAKAKAAAEKHRAKDTNRTSNAATEQAMEVESGAQPSTDAPEPASSSESDDDKTPIRCSHLHNLAAVLWCLTEVSPQAVEQCEKAAPVLCRVFAQAVRRGTEALQALRSDAASKITNGSGGKVDVGRKDQMVIERAWVEAASGCLNALVTLSDSNARICAALVGISRQELMSVIKGKAKSVAHVLDDTTRDDLPRAQGRENVASLCSAVTLLQNVIGESLSESTTSATALVRQVRILGLLALAAVRNVQASLPSHFRQDIKAAVPDAESCSLSSFETHTGLTCLGQMLQRAASVRAEVLALPLALDESGSDATAASLVKQRQAQEEFGNLNLALEVLSELVGDREGWSKDAALGGSGKQQQDASVEEDEGEDIDSDADDEMQETSEDDVEESNLMDEEDDMADNVKSTTVDFRQTRIAKALTTTLLESLLRLAFDHQESSSLLTQTHEASASLRGIVIRALSVISNALLVLASYAQPPPSQPVADATQQKRITSFQSWLTQSPQKEMISTLWRWSFEMASRAASSPLLAAPDTAAAKSDNDEAREVASAEAKRIVESCLGIMWSVSRCYEGMDGEVAANVLMVESNQFANDAHCTTASQGIGVVESLLAAYRSSKQDSAAPSVTTTAAGLAEGTLTAAAAGSSDVTMWASVDGIRVHCLGVLSTLARQAHVWPTHLSSIATLLLRVLDAIPHGSGRQATKTTMTSAALAALELADWTSFDGMVVAVNGVIDTFADEARSWDEAYTALKLQGKLKRASHDVRAATRAIDKRKQTGLRLAADEAYDNLMGFLQYRESLQ